MTAPEKQVLSNKRISAFARLVLLLLEDHRNKNTGQCNPKRKTLAAELGIEVRKKDDLFPITKALIELRKAGLIRSKQERRTNSYELWVAPSVNPKGAMGCSGEQPTPAGPLYELKRGNLGVRALKRASAGPPSNQSSPNGAPDPSGIPRKDAGREAEPLDVYYSAILDSMRNRGRLLTAAEERQIGALMVLQAAKKSRGA